jgi:hypothetical protein
MGGRPNRKIFAYSSFLEVVMSNRNRSEIHWQWVVGYLCTVVVLLACATVGGTSIPETLVATQAVPESLLRLENGAIELREENGDWTPVGGETTFEIVGELESPEPWMVTGNTFAVRELTLIDEGLEPGDRVRVKGLILEDWTWLAFSIERAEAEEQSAPTIILIGKVSSIDPWVVNGITLDVTSDTLISEGITTEMIVRVEILLLEDGVWEVLSIVPLGGFTDVPGCATVAATVRQVDGKEIQLAGWPAITLPDNVIIEVDGGGEGTLSVNESVLVVVCASEDGQIMITHIIILKTNEGEIPSEGGDKVLICHKPDKNGGNTLSISSSAVPAHLAHGDTLGPCP